MTKSKTEEPKKVSLPDLIKLLRKGPQELSEAASCLGIAEDRVTDLISQAADAGYLLDYDPGTTIVHLVRAARFGTTTSLAEEGVSTTGRKLTFMVVSDLGFGLKTQQATVVSTCYQEAKRRKVAFVVINGNLVAGKPTTRTRGDFFLDDAAKQADYVARALPRIPGVKQYLIGGWRELSWRGSGLDIGALITADRNDIRYVGDLRETFDIRNGTIITVIALNSDQVTYTLSYALRGLSENLMTALSFAQEQRHEPKMVLIGGLLTHIEQPPMFPLKVDRRNNFYALSSYGLHAMTSSQVSRKKRGGSPELGCQFVTLIFDKENRLIDIQIEAIGLTAWQRFNDFYAPVKILPQLSSLERQMLDLLAIKPRTVGELSRIMDKPKVEIQKLQIRLNHYQDKRKRRLYEIGLNPASARLTLKRKIGYRFAPLPRKDISPRRPITFGYLSDPHIGSKDSRPELWTRSLQVIDARQVAAGIVPGDVFSGTNAYPGQFLDLMPAAVGADAQRNLGLAVTPTRLHVPFYLIRGSSHEKEYWTKVGHDVVATFAEIYNLRHGGKPIMRYLGGIQAVTPNIRGVRHLMLHPKGGATIGRSYRGQVWIENYLEKLQSIGANVFAMGHLHIPMLFVYKGIPVVMVPSFEDQTEYLEGKTLMPYLGMWIITYRVDRLGNISSIIPEYIAYEPK